MTLALLVLNCLLPSLAYSLSSLVMAACATLLLQCLSASCCQQVLDQGSFSPLSWPSAPPVLVLSTHFLSSYAALTPPFMYARYDFLCSNPRCRSLLLHPLVLNCGHAVCADTCSPFHGKGPYACSRCQAVLTAQVAVCKQVRDRDSCMNAWDQRPDR